jgi:hypothetical protein
VKSTLINKERVHFLRKVKEFTFLERSKHQWVKADTYTTWGKILPGYHRKTNTVFADVKLRLNSKSTL